ncbi:MAG: hypothetical protein OEX07_15865 [Gammaproteobacteria bacterium]|nr:hypothetical protein [Gammaproteobacteria bacterium]
MNEIKFLEKNTAIFFHFNHYLHDFLYSQLKNNIWKDQQACGIINYTHNYNNGLLHFSNRLNELQV